MLSLTTDNPLRAEDHNLKDLVQLHQEEVTINLRHNLKNQSPHQECQVPANYLKLHSKRKTKEMIETMML